MAGHPLLFQFLPKTGFQQGPITAKVTCISFSASGLYFAAGIGELLFIWNSSDVSGEPLVELRNPGSQPTCIVPHLEGILCGFSSGQIASITVDLTVQSCKAQGFRASKSAITFIACHPSGSLMSIAGPGGTSIWRVNSPFDSDDKWQFIKFLPQPDESSGAPGVHYEVTSLGWRVDSTNLVVSYRDYGVITWDVSTSQQLWAVHLAEAPQGAISPDGRQFVLSTNNGFHLIDTETGQHLQTSMEPKPEFLSNAAGHMLPAIFLHEGYWVLAASVGKANLWRVDVNRVAQELLLNEEHLRNPIRLIAACTVLRAEGNDWIQICAVYGNANVLIWEAIPGLDDRNPPAPEPQSRISRPRPRFYFF